ncbi:hypothetical protein EYF80_060715 [Liparis tanakae]|uniref:Uncharacterized protein n=1 Tax=Liparis tanakae TaxID=230148 RepID=A0A4Z2EJM0_9TELE|nr:hypothetical protein EYF80_060715 [Liparis tanakae]
MDTGIVKVSFASTLRRRRPPTSSRVRTGNSREGRGLSPRKQLSFPSSTTGELTTGAASYLLRTSH